MAGLAAKSAFTSTMSSIEKQIDQLTASDKASKQEREEEKPLTKKEKKQLEKDEKKLAELKEKKEKDQAERQSKRAEMRNAMRAKYGLATNTKDEELISKVEEQKMKEIERQNSEQPPESPPAWGESSPSLALSTSESAPTNFEYPDDNNPFNTDSTNPQTLMVNDSTENDEFLEKLQQEQELEKKKKELEKIEKKMEKQRQKQEEKELKQQEKEEKKARKERQKQSFKDWKERKDTQKSIVTEHERKSALYEKYGVKSDSRSVQRQNSQISSTEELPSTSSNKDAEAMMKDEGKDNCCIM